MLVLVMMLSDGGACGCCSGALASACISSSCVPSRWSIIFFQIANVPWMLMIVGHTPRVPRTEERRFSPIRNTPHVILVTLLSSILGLLYCDRLGNLFPGLYKGGKPP
jgi:hypothetical protein